jgi:hypothetical protein
MPSFCKKLAMNIHLIFRLSPIALLLALTILSMSHSLTSAQDVGSLTSPGVTLNATESLLVVSKDSFEANSELRLPRVFASLVDAHWTDNVDKKVEVHPEPTYWILRWKEVPENPKSITLRFDQTNVSTTQSARADQRGDGSIWLRADQGITQGEKLRYEPQPHKNTIGYWVVASDWVHWDLNISRPATFNVGLLTGCGQGQGGSIAAIEIKRDDQVLSELELEVMETGHFQNFRWRDVGQLTFEEPGQYQLIIRSKKIAKAALMDVRQVVLTPVPK